MTEAQKELLLLIGENLTDYLREKYYKTNLATDRQNFEDLKEAMFRVETEK